MLSPRFKKDLHMGPKQSEMHFEKQEKEKNESYPDANNRDNDSYQSVAFR